MEENIFPKKSADVPRRMKSRDYNTFWLDPRKATYRSNEPLKYDCASPYCVRCWHDADMEISRLLTKKSE